MVLSCLQYIQHFLALGNYFLQQGDVVHLLLELPGGGLDPLHRIGGDVVSMLLGDGLGLHLEAGMANGVLLSPGQHILASTGQSIKRIGLLAGKEGIFFLELWS